MSQNYTKPSFRMIASLKFSDIAEYWDWWISEGRERLLHCYWEKWEPELPSCSGLITVNHIFYWGMYFIFIFWQTFRFIWLKDSLIERNIASIFFFFFLLKVLFILLHLWPSFVSILLADINL